MNEKPNLDVLCLGVIVADVFASPLDQIPSAGELRVVDEIYPDTGGCAANTGVSLAKLGARVGLVGKVGDDVFGEFIIRDMAARGLDVSGIQRSETVATSKTMIIPVVGEDRRFIHTPGANADLSYQDIEPVQALITRAKVLYVGGYLGLPKLDQASLAKLLRFAKEQGLQTVLDVIVPAGRSDYRVSTHLAQVLPYTDVFLPNEDEGRLLTGETTPAAQAECFLSYGCPNVVITRGERGTLVASREQMVQTSAFEVSVVDPSGSGDAFDAGYIFGLLQGWDMLRTVSFASAMGASACTELGCTPGVFTLQEARDFLARNQLEIEIIEHSQ